MKARSAAHEAAGFAIAPWASSLLLATLFSIPASPLFLDKLADPRRGSWFAFWVILLDGTLLAYLTELLLGLPLHFSLKREGRASGVAVLALGAVAGVAASQFANLLQHFHQPGLRAFAGSCFRWC